MSAWPKILSVIGAGILACADPLAPRSAEVGEFRLRLTTSPDIVARESSTSVRLVITNTTSDVALVGSGSSCLAHIGVFRDGVRQGGFPGTDDGCFTVLTGWEVSPGDSLVSQWLVGVPSGVRAGDYVVRVTFDNTTFPTLEQRLRVR